MRRWRLLLVTVALLSFVLPQLDAQDEKKPDETKKKVEKKSTPKKSDGKTKSVEELTEYAKQSVVVILYTGREGKQQGLGTGFVISDDGLVATNLHVIGDGRPISVLLPDGTKKEATVVHASDRSLDLAIIKVDTKGLKPLPLGDSETLRVGQPLVAIGHPQGLKYSVVAGVLSGRREVEAIQMLQIAMPVEPGNSGGPVLDMQGRVIGVVTMKSLVTNNLGFAVPIASLERLIKRPNPIPMENWVTLGALDKSEWQPAYGGRWQQRSGRITADGTGTGFGGRTVCFWQRGVPAKMPYEVSVAVKLDDESGAAGLIFGGQGEDRHFGFYPSGNKLRLTRFNGPDVYSWKILRDEPSKHYHPGEWNTLKVRLEKDRLLCFVNGEQVYELESPEYFGKTLGLAKFRQTVAEYKKFQAGTNLAQGQTPTAVLDQIKKAISGLPEIQSPSSKQFEPLLKTPVASMSLLRDRAQQLEKQAIELRKLATKVHHEGCLGELSRAADGEDAKIDLLRAALVIAKIDNEELEVDTYLKEVDRLAKEIQTKLPKDADEDQRLEALVKYMFEQRGFHGSRADYYSRSNSYLNEVIDDREGLPITLSVLFMELAERLKVKVVGVALPGHFVVRFEPTKGASRLIDVYEGGRVMSEQEAQRKVLNTTGNPLRNKDLNTVSKKAILVRMLHNLLNLAEREKDTEGVLRYLDGILAVDPTSHEERWVRAVFRYQSNRRDEALLDCDYLIDNVRNPNIDLDRVREMKKLIEEGRK